MWTASIADKADRPRGRLNRSISTDVVLHLRELPNNALITGSNSPTADPRGATTQCDCSSRIPPFTPCSVFNQKRQRLYKIFSKQSTNNNLRSHSTTRDQVEKDRRT